MGDEPGADNLMRMRGGPAGAVGAPQRWSVSCLSGRWWSSDKVEASVCMESGCCLDKPESG